MFKGGLGAEHMPARFVIGPGKGRKHQTEQLVVDAILGQRFDGRRRGQENRDQPQHADQRQIIGLAADGAAGDQIGPVHLDHGDADVLDGIHPLVIEQGQRDPDTAQAQKHVGGADPTGLARKHRDRRRNKGPQQQDPVRAQMQRADIQEKRQGDGKHQRLGQKRQLDDSSGGRCGRGGGRSGDPVGQRRAGRALRRRVGLGQRLGQRLRFGIGRRRTSVSRGVGISLRHWPHLRDWPHLWQPARLYWKPGILHHGSACLRLRSPASAPYSVLAARSSLQRSSRTDVFAGGTGQERGIPAAFHPGPPGFADKGRFC